MAAKRKEPEAPSGAPEWMATYSDLVTLLFCFFVLLFALSKVDAAKVQAFSDSFAGRPSQPSILAESSNTTIIQMMGNGIMEMPMIPESAGNTDGQEDLDSAIRTSVELSMMASDFKTYFAENNMQDEVSVIVEGDSVLLSFTEGILFDSGKAVLKDSAVTALGLLTDKILEYPDNDIRITGHTDNVPISGPQFPSNWHLSVARSASVGIYFIESKGFDPNRIDISGRGEYQPVDTNSTYEGRARNRRVEIRIMSTAYSNSSR